MFEGLKIRVEERRLAKAIRGHDVLAMTLALEGGARAVNVWLEDGIIYAGGMLTIRVTDPVEYAVRMGLPKDATALLEQHLAQGIAQLAEPQTVRPRSAVP